MKTTIQKCVEYSVVCAALISIGAVANEVSNIKEDMEKKADKEIVKIHHEATYKELRSLNKNLDRIYKIINYRYSGAADTIDSSAHGAHGAHGGPHTGVYIGVKQ